MAWKGSKQPALLLSSDCCFQSCTENYKPALCTYKTKLGSKETDKSFAVPKVIFSMESDRYFQVLWKVTCLAGVCFGFGEVDCFFKKRFIAFQEEDLYTQSQDLSCV